MPQYPPVFRVRQKFEVPQVADVAAEVRAQLARLELGRRVASGDRVAIAAGSRGVANLATILGALVEHLKGLGARPFIVPAMGSHGGGTAEGQEAILKSYGVTEAVAGCPIRSSMETVVVCRAA